MFSSSTIISIFVAVVLSLSRQGNACDYLHHETITPSEASQHEVGVADSDQHVIPTIPHSTREHWMRRANRVLSDLVSPCPFAAFASVIVNHTDVSSSPLGRLVCVGVNSASQRGNPTLHGEMDAINRCSEVLQNPPFGLSPAEASLALRDLTLYTNGEPCPMCASAIRWAGFRECVYGTSIETLISLGWTQIAVPSREIFARSGLLPTETALIPDVLTTETDPLFSWQFDADAPCPGSCYRDDSRNCVPRT
ncbi:guanine deaminase [Nemania sp. FL0916]|nr:guanine deaminase [Nemania sp. FL0916]